MQERQGIRGRGTGWNPANRFDQVSYAVDEWVEPEAEPGETHRPRTELFDDKTRSVLTKNDSPDVGFDYSINPYRGCEHGCVYCYARPTHEYFGYSAGLDFETKLFVKRDAPALLRKELASPKWRPQLVALSGNTDCYQPIERELGITRQLLEVFLEYRNPVGIITKNRLVTRDVDVLSRLAAFNCVSVHVSVTTLDIGLNRKLEPRSSSPVQRLEAIRTLSQAGIPVGVMVAPIIPGLTDHEIPAILAACAEAGARSAGKVMLRLPHAVAPLFENWLDEHYPERKEKILNRLRSLRGGGLYKSAFGERMRGVGQYAEQTGMLFDIAARKHGYQRGWVPLSTEFFQRPGAQQMSLF